MAGCWGEQREKRSASCARTALQARGGERQKRHDCGMETCETSVSTSLGVRMASSSENDKRVAAFLALIRYAEFNKHVPADAYQELYGGRSFANLLTHPNIKVTRWGHSSTAAGAYQINKKTYDDAVKHGIAFDFQKQSQDAIAIWEIQKGCIATYLGWTARRSLSGFA